MWKNIVDLDRLQMTKRMRIACWITKGTKYVIVIAFPQKQWLRERTSMSRYMYIILLGVKLIATRFFCSFEKKAPF